MNIWQPCNAKFWHLCECQGFENITNQIFGPNLGHYTNSHVSIIVFLDVNEKKQISGNTDMRNLATLLVVGLRKYHQSLFRPKKPTR